jgi:sugar phosphate isomerase/epimerase
MTRSKFLQLIASSAVFASAGCNTCICGRKPRYALQLYSIHKIFWKNPVENLAALKACGYDGVEFAGYNGKSALELRNLLAYADLVAAGTHVNGDIALVGDKLNRTLDFCAEAGIESITTPHAKRDSEDAYRKFGHDIGLAAEAAAKYGIKVGIHTTYHHFTTRYNGVSAWDVIYSEASPLLQQQIDTGNTFHTGEDLVALLKKYRNRHHSIHAKENVPTIDGVLGVPPKDGGKCVPWNEVFAYMKTETEQKWWIVEAEGRPDSLDPAVKCVKFLEERI